MLGGIVMVAFPFARFLLHRARAAAPHAPQVGERSWHDLHLIPAVTAERGCSAPGLIVAGGLSCGKHPLLMAATTGGCRGARPVACTATGRACSVAK